MPLMTLVVLIIDGVWQSDIKMCKQLCIGCLKIDAVS
jgi:hypothetical protein